MEVRYRHNVDDMKSAQKYICQRLMSRRIWRFAPVVGGAIFGLLSVVGVMSFLDFYRHYSALGLERLTWGLASFVIGTVALVVGMRLYTRDVMRHSFTPEGVLLGEHTVALQDAALIMSVNHSQYRYGYADMLTVESDNRYVYVFIDRGLALYIPSRAFASETARTDFIRDLQGRIEQQGKTHSTT